MPTTYRPSTTADLEGIVEVFLACWRQSYAAVLPQRLVDSMTDERARELWTRVLGEVTGTQVLVAESGDASGRVIFGVVRVAVQAHGEGVVHSLYVAPRAHGRGVGSGLLSAACVALTSAGSVRAHLWVFRDNAPSVTFYRHQGWLPDGHTRVQEEFGEPEIRLSVADLARGVRAE